MSRYLISSCLVLSVASFAIVAATENATALRVRTFLETPSPYGVTYASAKDLGADGADESTPGANLREFIQ